MVTLIQEILSGEKVDCHTLLACAVIGVLIVWVTAWAVIGILTGGKDD